MHLAILAHIFLIWVVCHPSKTFPPKELEWKPQNRLPFLPSARPHPLLPLTCDPPPLYWLGTSRWCLSLIRAPLPYEFIVFLAFMRLSLPAGLSSPVTCSAACLTFVAWMSHWVFILCILFLLWAGHCLGVDFFFFNSAPVSFHF